MKQSNGKQNQTAITHQEGCSHIQAVFGQEALSLHCWASTKMGLERVWFTMRWLKITIMVIKTWLGIRLTWGIALKKLSNKCTWTHMGTHKHTCIQYSQATHRKRAITQTHTSAQAHTRTPGRWGKMRSDSERDHWLRAVNRWLAGGSVKPVSDGAAFNRLLCLSQLCYIMASNTWANTVLRKCCVH